MDENASPSIDRRQCRVGRASRFLGEQPSTRILFSGRSPSGRAGRRSGGSSPETRLAGRRFDDIKGIGGPVGPTFRPPFAPDGSRRGWRSVRCFCVWFRVDFSGSDFGSWTCEKLALSRNSAPCGDAPVLAVSSVGRPIGPRAPGGLGWTPRRMHPVFLAPDSCPLAGGGWGGKLRRRRSPRRRRPGAQASFQRLLFLVGRGATTIVRSEEATSPKGLVTKTRNL